MYDELPDAALFFIDVSLPWYADIAKFFSTAAYPLGATKHEKKKNLLQAQHYTLLGGYLYRYFPCEGIYRRCVRENEVPIILCALHDEPCGGHFAGELTARKVLFAGYWWPTLHKDSFEYCKRCDKCQWIGRPTKQFATPLTPILALKPFEKWGIDFVGPIDPPTRYRSNRYILVCTDYVTKWVEAKPLKIDREKDVAKFLYEDIITRFGSPLELVSDRGSHFLNETIQELTDLYAIKHTKSTPYYPRANGQVEVTNRIIGTILMKNRG